MARDRWQTWSGRETAAARSAARRPQRLRCVQSGAQPLANMERSGDRYCTRCGAATGMLEMGAERRATAGKHGAARRALLHALQHGDRSARRDSRISTMSDTLKSIPRRPSDGAPASKMARTSTASPRCFVSATAP
eukprot:11314770-Alexandrium_andersonii.AAC.1